MEAQGRVFEEENWEEQSEKKQDPREQSEGGVHRPRPLRQPSGTTASPLA